MKIKHIDDLSYDELNIMYEKILKYLDKNGIIYKGCYDSKYSPLLENICEKMYVYGLVTRTWSFAIKKEFNYFNNYKFGKKTIYCLNDLKGWIRKKKIEKLLEGDTTSDI